MSVPNVSAYFKQGKSRQAENTIESNPEATSPLNSEDAEDLETSEEMVLVITTLPTITAIMRENIIEVCAEPIT